ncbi:MAG TPA: DNA primase [Gemmatimonadales bacterium]|jgi:DNA primase|nr:DNA primase [Gemmatimonadales bacterium]
MIPDDVIEQVRDAADIVGIIGESVELKRTGADYRGRCPFHGGTHRNFAVIPRKGMFYCFVCHEAGDVYTFFMKRLGMDYPTAVREVARRVGITIPERSGPTAPDPREPLFAAVATAADWFARQLRESPEAETARKYLESRHVTMEQAQVAGLGFAPRGPAFLAAMKGLGLREEVLLEAGLTVKREDGSTVPRFRGRLLFPIHDLRSRVVAFSGRILGEGEPKYLNSPESPIFHKGQLLYNLHLAKHGMRKAERAILVEGQFDVLRLTLAGVEEVIAPLGTGLTDEQAALLQRHTAHVILLYDSDDPGLRATFRAGDVLLRHKLRVSVATLPEGEDPDTLVQNKGAAALDETLKDAIDIVDRKIQILTRRGFFGSLPGRRRALDALLPTIRAAADPVARDLYLSRVAEVAGIRKQTLEEEVLSRLDAPRQPTPKPVDAAVEFGPAAKIEKTILLVMLSSDEWRARVLAEVDSENIASPTYRAVFDAIAENRPDRLDEISARTLEDLQATGLGVVSPDDSFTWALNSIEADRKSREIALLQREIDLAPEADKLRLTLEKRALTDERNAKRPTWKILEHARRKGAPGS